VAIVTGVGNDVAQAFGGTQQDAVAVPARQIVVVSYKDDRLSLCLSHPPELLHHDFRRRRVERTGGLVGQDNGGLRGEGPGDGDPLLLATRQLLARSIR